MPVGDRDADLLARIQDMFDTKIPFNRVLGLEVRALDYERPQVGFHMRDELSGNYVRETLHGGVISAAIDVTGGLTAFLGLQQRLPEQSIEQLVERFGQLGTIDLRVDYLRPGRGKSFTATGHNLRTGRRVAVARVELRNNLDELIAVGTGSYVVS